MSAAEDTTQIPEVVVADVVAAVINDLQTAISNTFEAPENATKTILEESQAVIDETTKLIEEIATTMVAKDDVIVDESKLVEETTKTIVDETAKLVEPVVESVVKTGENIANIVSDEEKRLTETISRLSIEMEQDVKKATGLFARIRKFIKLITSCTHGADKSVSVPVKVSADDVDVKVNVV